MTDSGTIKMGKDHCPHCETLLDHATAIEKDHKVDVGDISVCIRCGGLNQFSDDFSLIKLNKEIFSQLDDKTKRQLHLAQEYIAKRGPISQCDHCKFKPECRFKDENKNDSCKFFIQCQK